jgi:cell division septal protein FtsQ
MFLTKRKLKKERSKFRFKILVLFLILLLFVLLTVEYLFLNLNSKKPFISPIVKPTESVVLDLEKELKKYKISFSSMVYEDGNIVLNLKDGGVVILSSKKDISLQLSSLQLILSRLTIEGKKLKSLDLRFDSPIISF